MFILILDLVEDFHTVEVRRLHRIFCGLFFVVSSLPLVCDGQYPRFALISVISTTGKIVSFLLRKTHGADQPILAESAPLTSFSDFVIEPFIKALLGDTISAAAAANAEPAEFIFLK